MKRHLFLFVGILFVSQCAISADTISIEVIGLGKAPKKDAGKIWSAFGGQTDDLFLALSGASKEKIEISADLLQTSSGKIAVPVKTDIPIRYDSDAAVNPPLQIVFALEIPAVERVSDFVIRYRYRPAGEEKWRSAGSARIRAYPPDILKPVQAFAQKYSIYLYGESEKLSAFLKENQIKFEDMKDNFTKEEKKPCLILAEYSDKDWFQLPKDLPSNQAMIVFYPSFRGLPRTIIRQAGKGIQAQIKMDLLENLMHDPEAQEFLVEIFNLSLDRLPENPN